MIAIKGNTNHHKPATISVISRLTKLKTAKSINASVIMI